jgi:hypothetical protein
MCKKESQMPEDSVEKDEGQRALDELYKDGSKPTLKELLEVTRKYDLKIVSVKFPTGEEEENPERNS